MKISIVVPFYGNPKNQVMYDMLARCIDSISNQTFNDYELIVSREGTDLSSSRNWGIEHAHGDYLMFADADDYISEDLFAVLADAIKKYPEADIIEFPTLVHEGGADEHLLTFEEKQYTNLISDYWLGCKAYTHSYACNKIYKRRLFDQVRFPVGRKFEDVYTLPLLLEQAKVVKTISKGLYHYVWNSNGICAKADGKDLLQLLQAHVETFKKHRFHEEKFAKTYFVHILNIQIDVYNETRDNLILPNYNPRKTSKPQNLKTSKPYNICVCNAGGLVNFIKFAVYKMFGLKILCKLWSLL